MVKWITQQKASTDPYQHKLDQKSLAEKLKDEGIIVTHTEPDYSATYMCPFCLNENALSHYLQSSKKGISKIVRCPQCQATFLMKTLTADMTIEQFAAWVYGYSKMGFWQKINFKQFSDRLYQLRISQQFWDAYHKTKSELQTEKYEDYIIRQQMEDHYTC